MNDWLHHGTHSSNDPRPDSATSSVLSRDSGVARSDPKSSRDFSAKSESSSRSPFNPNSNTLMSNGFLTKYGRNGLPNMTRAYPSQPASAATSGQLTAATSEINVEQLREKLQPLNTQRLKTLRQATKSFIVNALCPRERGETKRLLSLSLDEHYGKWRSGFGNDANERNETTHRRCFSSVARWTENHHLRAEQSPWLADR